MNPTSTETRAPKTTWDSTSSPAAVVPNQCAELPGWLRPKPLTDAPYGAMSGAKTAIRTKTPRTTSVSRAFLLLQMVATDRVRTRDGDAGPRMCGTTVAGSVLGVE